MRAMRPCYGGCEHYHYDWKDFEGYDGGYDEDYGYDDIYWELRGPCEWCGLWLRYWPDFKREPFFLEIADHFSRIHKHFDDQRPHHPAVIATEIRRLATFMRQVQYYNDRGQLMDRLIRRLGALAHRVEYKAR